jgi:hypothetical protein
MMAEDVKGAASPFHALIAALDRADLHQEAEILSFAVAAASRALEGDRERHRHTLIVLSEAVCARLDKLEAGERRGTKH